MKKSLFNRIVERSLDIEDEDQISVLLKNLYFDKSFDSMDFVLKAVANVYHHDYKGYKNYWNAYISAFENLDELCEKADEQYGLKVKGKMGLIQQFYRESVGAKSSDLKYGEFFLN